MNKPLLRARGIRKSYRMGPALVQVLRGATVEAAEGEFLAIMGSSGSGKSTLLHVLGALDTPDQGSVEFRGQDVFGRGASAQQLYRNRDVGFVFQFYHLLPELNVLENVLAPRLVGQSVSEWWLGKSAANKEARTLLDRMGLGERIRHRPRELSGGERQRVAIARALINRPSLLLADEPTGNLDEAIGTEILELLAELNRKGQTIVMVTHDAKVSARAHRCLRLSEGVLRETNQETPRKKPAAVAAREVLP